MFYLCLLVLPAYTLFDVPRCSNQSPTPQALKQRRRLLSSPASIILSYGLPNLLDTSSSLDARATMALHWLLWQSPVTQLGEQTSSP